VFYFDNGISKDIVDRELEYALKTTEMLYKINLRKYFTLRYYIFNKATLIIRFFRLEHIIKKIFKWRIR